MLNKDKRSLILSLILGDGCLHYHKTNYKNKTVLYGGLTIDHGVQQSDYITWKAQIVSKLFDREVKLRTGHNGKSIQFSVCSKKLRAWRRFCYPSGKKDIAKILPFIRHPEFAVAIWLMDDGYVEPSFSKLKNGDKKNYGARFRIFTNSQTLLSVEYTVDWFKKQLGVEPKIKHHTDSRTKVTYPILKFTQEDSLKIWEKIREVVLAHKSMQYKFRYIEDIYKIKVLQRVPSKS